MTQSRKRTRRSDPMLPLCDGRPAPSRSSKDPVEKRMREFASVYQRLNVAYERLRKARTGESKEAPNAILEEIDRIVHDRDALEDRLSPEGFYAEAVIEGLVTVDLIFSYAQKRSIAPPKPEPVSSFSLYIPMPEEGEDIEMHLRKLLGPLFGIKPADALRKKKTGKKSPPKAVKRAARPVKKSKSPSRPKTKKKRPRGGRGEDEAPDPAEFSVAR